MSQDVKKPKPLTTKRIPKTKKNQVISKDVEMVSNNMNLDSFITLSSMNHEGSKDDSLFSLGSNLKDSFSMECEDVFQFPEKNSTKSSVNRNIDSEIKNHDVVDKQISDQNISLNDSSVLFYQRNACVNNRTLSNYEENSVKDELEEDIAIPCNSESLKCDVVKSSEESAESKKQCPVCLKLFTSDKYVNHMKSCAAKNNLSTQKLLDALKLHQKQQLERKELGLNVPVQSSRAKGSPKKQRVNEKKGPLDANLQLAIALSASLRSAEEKELIEEAEALNSAGLKEEAQEKLSTLERFGFASLQPPQSSTGISKNRPAAPSLLLNRSKEERDRIVTEKVAIVLISEGENDSLESLNFKEPKLNSRVLKKEWNKETLLWKKAQRLDLEERSLFYVVDFLEFISITEAVVERNVQTVEDISKLVTPPRSLNVDQGEHFSMSSGACKQHLSKLGNDWSTMVNNNEISDVEVICKNGEKIPAHKLVLYVRCPKVLNIILKSEEGKEEIYFDKFSFLSTLAFLDFLYCGSVDRIRSLSNIHFTELCCIVERFEYTELRDVLKTFKPSMRRTSVKQKLRFAEQFSDDHLLEENSNMGSDSIDCSPISKESLELNSIHTPKTEETGFSRYEECKERSKSPDMFDELKVRESSTQSELDCLASLIGKASNSCERTTKSLGNQKYDDVIPNTSNEYIIGKRKASTCSLSEEEKTSIAKKRRSNEAKNEDCEEDDVVYDLTQSSASNEINECKRDFEGDKFTNINHSPSTDDSINDLTQKSPSLDNKISKEECSNLNESVQSKNLGICNDFIDPIWDCFDDGNFHSNYSPIVSPNNLTEASNELRNDISTVFEHGKKCDNFDSMPTLNASKIKTLADSKIIDQPSFNGRNNHEYLLSSDSDLEFEINTNHPNPPESAYYPTNKIAITETTNVKIDLSSIDFNTSTKNPPVNSGLDLKLDEEDHQLKSPVQRDSLAQRLLNDSFEIDNFACVDTLVGPTTDTIQSPSQWCKKTALETEVTTPSPKLLVSDNITPLPNYSAMKTPALKKELSKFGLKPGLGKRKAKLLLRYIYDETHPFVPNIQHASESQAKSSTSRTPTKITDKRTDSDSEMSSSQRSVSSSSSATSDLFEEISHETQEPPASENLRSVIRNLILQDSELHHKVLMYEPIFLEDLMNRLKSNGTKGNIKSVMDYLDEQCITFRTKSWKATNQKRRQQIAKKKRKVEKTTSNVQS